MSLLNKKTLIASTLTLTVLCGALFVGCSNNNQSNNNEVTVKNVDLTSISSNLENSQLFATMNAPIPVKDFPAFEEIQNLIEDGFAYRALMNVKFEDVVLVKTSEPETVVEALNTYLKSDSVKLFKDGYGGEDNITAVQNAKVGNVGNYVYLVASTNSDKIETLILDSLK